MRSIGTFVLALLPVLIGSAGCVDEPVGAAEICSSAAEHLAACEDTETVVASDSCDIERAREILDTDCETLAVGLSDTKSDFFGFRRFMCGLGVYRYCEQVECRPEDDEAEFAGATAPDPDAVPGSSCLQAALQYEGCGACAYYACREQRAQCGADGYLSAFGEKYCLRFRTITEKRGMSPAGKQWMHDVRRCLIETLDRTVPGDDCDAIETGGFASHAGCYVDSGFCELPISDWLAVLATVDSGDAPLRQAITTGVGCLRRWLSGE